MKFNKPLSPSDALTKLQRYCAYQDRSVREATDKLRELGVLGKTATGILAALNAGGYLDEERFASAFVRGKFRSRQWGRIRIRRELQMKGVAPEIIQQAMEEISEEAYRDTLLTILEKKAAQLDESDAHLRKNKLAQYALQRGFEASLVWEFLKTI